MKRREFVRSAGGATALGAGASATAGTAAAAEGDGGGGGGGKRPDFGGYTDGAKGGAYEDLRGNDEVTVEVGAGSGGLAFAPTDLWIDTGTTVVFEWVGGQSHNVLFDETPSGASVEGYSEVVGSGTTHEVTFDTGGVYKYFCQPHKGLGMVGAVAVGDGVPTKEAAGGGGGEKPLHALGVPIQAHWVGAATILGIAMTVVFSFYVLKYGESPHTGTGR
ncbi:plastocyanin/azurin family copper-binding protein [Halobaculum sp. MBLA0147]|uniref:plastocyanin/azurin family copper-binding protein n=1 Tax=Halobaculum sp. MBLA0147 TaxID=3079934 RepID=UPI0035260216